MQETKLEIADVTPVATPNATEPQLLSDLEIELLDKVGGGWLSWGY